MKNSDLPAMPQTNSEIINSFMETESVCPNGLTKFEHAVIEAMKGLASNPNIVTDMHSTNPEEIGEYAINIAIGVFSMLAELDKD